MEDAGSATAEPTAASRKKEIYTYEAPWLIYGMNWSNRRNKPFRLALGSFIEEYNNSVEVIQLNEETQAFERVAGGTFNHPYPTTKIMWSPESVAEQASGELLATTGDYLRLWEVRSQAILAQLLVVSGEILRDCGVVTDGGGRHDQEQVHAEQPPGVRVLRAADVLRCDLFLWAHFSPHFLLPFAHVCTRCADSVLTFSSPLCSDWNETDPNLIGTSSIDTTCTIWDIETQQVRTQLIAHDKEVYDVSLLLNLSLCV